MNLRDYIERMKMWIDKQHFIMRHISLHLVFSLSLRWPF